MNVSPRSVRGVRLPAGVTAAYEVRTLYGAGAFERAPKGCPEVIPCATSAALDWFPTLADRPASSPRIPDVRYAETSTQQCVAIGDAVLCAPTRVPSVLPPQVTP